ncbi:MAG: thioesterase [Bdellovibrionales bacterium RIFCSPHIGHO2_01_FULL_40_29]|nr:MAG: thioesterase [Bdellovibrionales bacterium RIFCSPHIGHO2_01_FULL_40_29]OFZ33965.1 MAG: thioesterase [Bdellovibrionales bacterium RIFCSPHIGHO2_02_FULL_40_15]
MFEYKILIREQHLDSYGHVNNATYLTLFEEARWEMSTQQGYGYQAVHDSGKGPVILEIGMKFLKEVTLREMVTIRLMGITQERKISRIKQTMFKEDGQVGCELDLVVGFFDLKTRRLITPSPEWQKVLDFNG